MSQSRRVLHNRYELQQKIGDGGMAVVYKARDTMLNRVVAVKVLRDQYAADPNFLARFEREAQSAANLTHPNIVNVYDTGEENGTHYIVMELVDGESLKEKITREAPLDVHTAIDLTGQIASAIDYAHRQGLIHRDIKPQNILLTRDGVAKVTDFGIAKGLSDATLTQTGVALGTVHYFSPEQARGEPARAESDLYSIAVVLYEMLTGRLPFEAESPVALALKHIEEPPPPPRRYNPAIPPMVEAIIMKALSKRMEQRYPTVGAFATALKAAESQAPGVDGNAPTRIAPQFSRQQSGPLPAADATRLNGNGAQPYDYGYRPDPYAQPSQPRSAYYNESTGGGAAYYGGRGYTNGYSGALPPEEPVRRGGGGWGIFILGFILLALLIGIVVAGVVFVLPQLSATPPTATAAPIAATATPLPPTPTSTPQPVQVVVPSLANQTQDMATANLKNAGLVLGQVGQGNSDTVAKGRVMDQSPAPGGKANEGSKVNITISNGPEMSSPFPGSYANTSPDAAIAQLEGQGFTVIKKEEYSASIQAGAVSRTDPPITQGTQLQKGTTVTVYVSEGPPPPTIAPNQATVPVPQVRSMSQADATKKLSDLGFKVKVIAVHLADVKNDIDYFKSQPVGFVVGQDPDETQNAAKGSTVTIAVKADG